MFCDRAKYSSESKFDLDSGLFGAYHRQFVTRSFTVRHHPLPRSHKLRLSELTLDNSQSSGPLAKL